MRSEHVRNNWMKSVINRFSTELADPKGNYLSQNQTGFIEWSLLVSIRDIEKSKEKGVDWILSKMNVDGSISPYERAISSYYRLPWAFAVTGHSWEGVMLLEWFRRNMFNAEGDFAGKHSRDDADGMYPYPNSNLIYGAHLLRQFDLSFRGMDFLLTLQDQETGGFYSRKDDLTSSGEQDIWVSSQAGLTCLMTGYIKEAQKVGSYLEKMWDLQPDPENRLHYVYTSSKGLSKKAVVDTKESKQLYFQPGIAAAFLARLYMTTHEERHRDLAKEYIEFAMRCSDDKFSRPQVRKSGWGAGFVYQITKDTRYRLYAKQVLNYILDAQYPGGHWANLIASSLRPELYQAIETSAEAIVHLDHITASINIY
jgi:hypothetical protein